MLMKKLYKRTLWNEVAFPEKYRAWEFALTDITADCINILVQEFGYLAGRVESEIEARHSLTSGV